MFSWKSRASTIGSYSTSVLGGLVIVLALSSYILTPPSSILDVTLTANSLVKLHQYRRVGGDGALFYFDLKTDLKPLFHWNLKMVYVYLSAEYKTQRNEINQVVLWDTIVEREELNHTRKEAKKHGQLRRRPIYHTKGVLDLEDLKCKYILLDDGFNLRNQNVTFKLNWNIVPNAGLMFDQIHPKTTSMVLPSTYIKARRDQDYSAEDEIN
ncbi:signal peptidase complex subunit 3 [Acrasis kona]|uniref:Signal peptidase complex subunit 3 n=1 Tax=Acrasis kona TaxID=1008807 RepID=A0AAW2Z2S3_9EUKA